MMDMQTVRAFFRMSIPDRGTVLRAARRLASVRFRSRHPELVPLTDGAEEGRRLDAARALRLAHLVRRTADCLPFTTTCLDRAVVLGSLLDDESLLSALRIGVRPGDAARLDAHAWVEHGDASLLVGDDSSSYVLFDTSLTAEKR